MDETPDGLQSAEYREAMKAREEMIGAITNEIAAYDAVIMTGPTNIMHFCGLPSVTLAGSARNESGVRQAMILYGSDECRLYSAALTLEKMLNAE